MVAHMFGPIEGSRHDVFMLEVSGLSAKLHRFVRPNAEPYIIYGDPAMALYRTLLLHSIKHTLQMMSRNLIQERTKFGHVSNGVLTKSAKIYYLVSCILINCHTCLYGSQSTTYLIWSCHPWKPIYPTRDHVYLVFLSLF